MNAARLFLVSAIAAVMGAVGGGLAAAGEIPEEGVALVLYFTMLGSVGLLGPAYAVMKLAQVPLLRRYVGVLFIGAVAGSLFLLPLDFVTGHLNGAPLGGLYGFITALCWVALHAISKRLIPRNDPVGSDYGR